MNDMKKPLLFCTSTCIRLFAITLVTGCGGEEPIIKPPPPVIGTREELADAESLELFLDPLRAPIFGNGRYFQTGSYDRESGAVPPAAFLANGNRDMNHFACRGVEGSVNDAQIVPMIFDVATCPESYVKGVALARIEGSGRLVRFWMTASSLRHGAIANEEILRIWVDDDPNPVVEEPLAAFIDGSAGEMFAPPFGDGPGDHVAWYYPVVFGKKIVVGLDNLGPLEYYYDQVAVVLDREPVARKAAATRLDIRDDAISVLNGMDKAGELHGLLVEPLAFSALAGQTMTLLERKSAATIHSIRVAVAKDMLPLLQQVEWQVTWDDATTPAMKLPMSDLFVSSLDAPELGKASLGLARFDNNGVVELELRVPMPFEQSAKFVVRNDNANPVDFTVSMRGIAMAPSEAFGHLYVERQETVAPALGKTHPLANVTGRGKWAGTCMMLEGDGIGDKTPVDLPLNFLEGDEFGTLDGERTIRGTGTEDYLNGAFYFEAGSHASPFAQWWGTRVNGLIGQTNACRFHLLGDTIDFAQSATLELEIGPGIPETLVRYRTITFLYR
jgi:hypothetical protein